MGSPIKGQVKRKNTSPSKKIHLFFLSSHFRASTASLYHLFSHPLFRSYRFRVSILLIRTSHPSGSRQLCFKRNCLKHGPWSVRTPENLRCHTVFNWTYYKSYGYQPTPYRLTAQANQDLNNDCCLCKGCSSCQSSLLVFNQPHYRFTTAPKLINEKASLHQRAHDHA